MKKIYLSLVLGGLCFGTATAQNATPTNLLNNFSTELNPVTTPNYGVKAGVEIWSNDFDTPTDWTIDNDGITGADHGWDIGSTSQGWWSANGITSTSGGNYAEVQNGDPTVTPGTQELGVAYTLTLASPIDIPNLPGNTSGDAVTLQFEEFGARFYDNQEVQVSTDGTTWTTVRNNSAYSQLTNSGGAAYANPETVQVNLAPFIAGNANSVWIRFSWTSEFPAETNPNAWVAYGWYIDDVKLFTNPDDDLALWSAYIAGENNSGSEYGITPADQVDANWAIGGRAFNNGVNDQTNLDLTADFTAFTATATEASLVSGDTVDMETIDPLTLTPAVYTGTYTLTSDGETGGTEFANNTLTRTFEISQAWDQTADQTGVYALDGIGVYPNPSVSSLGSASFTGAEDGLVLATLYHIKNTTPISGVRLMLNANSVAGGEIYGSIKDTTTFWANDMTSLFNTAPVVLTAADISAGYVDALFPAVATLNPGVYYAAAELYSNAGASHIRIADDETVDQPFDASAIYIPGDQSYTNGTAIGIRLLTGNGVIGLDENTLEGVSVYPNPSEGMLNISNENNTTNTITVYNMVGKVVLSRTANASTTINLAAQGTGVYMVEVANENGSFVERVVIK
ncbi:MAG: T9SS type A sorting domain-containing protein [Crocinitomicaceae bacterium]|nr:T9SS type A sorting domain-containing protein [Crocinitomicaceae bacterium]